MLECNRCSISIEEYVVVVIMDAGGPQKMNEDMEAIARMRAVTISREYGSGGGEVAARLAQRLGWQLGDHQIVAEAGPELDTPETVVQGHGEHAASGFSRLFGWPFPTTSQETQGYH